MNMRNESEIKCFMFAHNDVIMPSDSATEVVALCLFTLHMEPAMTHMELHIYLKCGTCFEDRRVVSSMPSGM